MSFTTLDGRTFLDVNNTLKICGVETFSEKNIESEKDIFHGRWAAHHVVKYLPESNVCMQYTTGIVFEYINDPEKGDVESNPLMNTIVEVKLAVIQLTNESALCAETYIVRKVGHDIIQHPDLTLPSVSDVSCRRWAELFILEILWQLERDCGYDLVIERDAMEHAIDAILS